MAEALERDKTTKTTWCAWLCKIITKIWESLIAKIAVWALTVAAAYVWGQMHGSEGKNPGFDKVTTELKLANTKWKVSYEDVDANKKPIKDEANISFDQYGTRVVGRGSNLEGREWIVEGAASARRLCYIYRDADPNKLSFGTVLLAMDESGELMSGIWLGWDPAANKMEPTSVTLKKIVR